jgi:seryl-tRNA synthetase
MIDINLLRADKGFNPEIVRASQRKRGGEKAAEIVDQVIALDNEWKSGNSFKYNDSSF